jgi:hypothetical protein
MNDLFELAKTGTADKAQKEIEAGADIKVRLSLLPRAHNFLCTHSV